MRSGAATVLLDATGITAAVSGLGRYSLSLVEALLDHPRYQFAVLHQAGLPADHPLFAAASRARLVPVRAPVVGPRRDAMMLACARTINEHAVYHCLSSYLPAFGVRTRSVLTVHDLKYVRGDAFTGRARAGYLRWILRRGTARATRVIAVSRSTRDDLVALGVAAEKIAVVHEAAAPPAVPARVPAGMPSTAFFLYVGVNRPHKNLARLLAAHAELARRMGERTPPLVLAGSGIRALSRAAGPDVVLLEHVTDQELTALYQSALALVYPSLYEGFGLPALEAMRAGLPVIASNQTSLPEVVGDAGVLVDPTDVAAMAAAMARMASDAELRRALSARGLTRAGEFSWARAAEQTQQIYDAVAACR